MDSDEDPDVTGADKDMWQFDDDRLIRHHNLPRRKFPSPQMKFPAGVNIVSPSSILLRAFRQRGDSTWWQQPVKETQERTFPHQMYTFWRLTPGGRAAPKTPGGTTEA